MSHCLLKIKIINESVRSAYETAISKMETEEYVKNPHKDSGFDLFIPEYEVNSFGVEKEYTYVFAKNRPKLIDLGIQCAAYEVSLNSALSPKPQPFMIYPRSSIYKTPFRFANNTGIIDSGYRGNLKAAFDNKENRVVDLPPFTRLLQICMPDLKPFKVIIVESLDDTTRGSGGFGSTGI
jgi:dUTP pyrophosphatase